MSDRAAQVAGPSTAAPAPATGRIGVLLVNLGTPEAPTPQAVRRYLAEFLSDRRVVEIPPIAWLPILHGIVLRTRPAKSARKYQSVWTPEGSPLAVWTARQATLLRGYLGERGMPHAVVPAMRYGEPAVARTLDALVATGVDRVLVVPLYPQYAASTTASVVDAVMAWTARARDLPELRFVKDWHVDPAYITALARQLEAHWLREGRPDRLVLSFHGLPQRSVDRGDPYQAQCLATSAALQQRLKLREGFVVTTFQSRFGRARWLQPYTEPTVIGLAQAGVGRVDVMCPGFVADCLETLEEIDQEVRAAFMAAGGREFRYVPCLNDRHEWIAGLAALVERHTAGWP